MGRRSAASRTCSKPAERPSNAQRISRPSGRPYGPGRSRSSLSKLWKHRLKSRDRAYSKKSARTSSTAGPAPTSISSAMRLFIKHKEDGSHYEGECYGVIPSKLLAQVCHRKKREND